MKRKKAIQVLSKVELCDEIWRAGWCSYYKEDSPSCTCQVSLKEERAAIRKAIDALKEKKS